MFWAYGDLSKLEAVCARSFVEQGFFLNLWSYGQICNAPSGARLRDAREVLPEASVFLNRLGSYASFADVFRYAVLARFGGLWADTDVAAVLPAAELPRRRFIVTEHVHGHLQINNNVIFDPSPEAGSLVALAYHYSINYPHDRVKWSELGPDLLTALASITPDLPYEIMPPEFANPIPSHQCPECLLDPAFSFDVMPAFVHLYNERWRMTGADKNQAYPEGSVMESLERSRALRVRNSGMATPPVRLTLRKARICAPLTPATPIRLTAEFFATLGRWSRVRLFQRFADSVWNLGLRIAAVQNESGSDQG